MAWHQSGREREGQDIDFGKFMAPGYETGVI